MSRAAALYAGLALVLLGAVATGLAVGPSEARLGEALREAFSGERPAHGLSHLAIVLDVRLPRVLLGLLVGSALAVAGVAYQCLLKNPLADPFILGVSGGAAVGAAVVLLFGATLFGTAHALSAPLAAFVGAGLASVVVYALAGHGAGTERLLLTGIVVNSFLSAGILILQHLAPPARRLVVLTWMTGSLGAIPVGPAELAPLAVFAVTGAVAFAYLARDLDLLSLGDDVASALGVRTARVRALLFAAGALVTAGAVSLSGLIGFVGLVVPHAVRLALGPGHRRLVPASLMLGGAALVLADALARGLLPPEELPVGVVTALFGCPLFLVLLRARSAS